jgi:sugar O-acyltransferase (sialic acid O-acetyltransferase NeuD family)
MEVSMGRQKVVIFGNRDTAQLANFYLKHDSEYDVVAFAVDKAFRTEDSFEGLPLVDFEDVETRFAPAQHRFFVPMTHRKMGESRTKKYSEAKSKGYSLISYVSSKATVFPGARIGDNCFILEDNTIQPFTSIGNNVVLWSGNHIGHHGEICDNVFFTSHVVMSGHVRIGEFSFLGVNATIRDGITLASHTLVGMGAIISKNTEQYGVYTAPSSKKWDEKKSVDVM